MGNQISPGPLGCPGRRRRGRPGLWVSPPTLARRGLAPEAASTRWPEGRCSPCSQGTQRALGPKARPLWRHRRVKPLSPGEPQFLHLHPGPQAGYWGQTTEEALGVPCSLPCSSRWAPSRTRDVRRGETPPTQPDLSWGILGVGGVLCPWRWWHWSDTVRQGEQLGERLRSPGPGVCVGTWGSLLAISPGELPHYVNRGGGRP